MYKYLWTGSYDGIQAYLDLINKEHGKIISVTDHDKFTIIYEIPDVRSEI